MFRRRHPLSWKQKLRELMWPSMGLRRVAVYYKHRMGRLRGTPSYIASGFATGVAISFTPFIGLHIATGAAVCWLTRGSMLGMVLATIMCGNIWTFPFIWIVTYKLGHLMMGHVHKAETGTMSTSNFTLEHLMDKPMELLVPMTLGSIPLGVVFWVFTFVVAQKIILRYKEGRMHRLKALRDRLAKREREETP